MKLVNYALPFDFRINTNWDAELSLGTCDRYNNAELTIRIRMFLDKIEVPTSIGFLLWPDADGVIHKIVPWGAYFERWKKQFKATAERAWHGRFWLKCPDRFEKWDYEDKHMIYRPNIWCRFDVKLVNSAAAAHHTIQCVRLHRSETSFRSHSTLYSQIDIRRELGLSKSPFRTNVHEVGHLLGLGHVNQSGPPSVGMGICKINIAANANDGSNSDACYGVLPEERVDVMGAGSKIRPWHAKPWKKAASTFSGLTADKWDAVVKRYYPRSILEIPLPGKGWHTSRPKRL